jgi:DNA invertase Pin-like site-specific DNA recombinase
VLVLGARKHNVGMRRVGIQSLGIVRGYFLRRLSDDHYMQAGLDPVRLVRGIGVMVAGAQVPGHHVDEPRLVRRLLLGGLGLEAQQEAVRTYLRGGDWQLMAEVVEVESGKKNNRPRLAEALRLCRLHGAILIIAKLDRLARNVAFISNLMESGVEFTAVDFPQANRLTVHILAAVAEHEREMISRRTKDALAAAKARGKKLGGNRGKIHLVSKKGAEASAAVRSAKAKRRVADIGPIVADIQASGATSLRQIAAALNERHIKTSRGKDWTPTQVMRVIEQR